MKWVNFRDAGDTARLKMKLRDPHTLKRALDAEILKGGPILVSTGDFPGALDHLPECIPGQEPGQIIRAR